MLVGENMTNFNSKREYILEAICKEIEKTIQQISFTEYGDEYAGLVRQLDELENSKLYWQERTEEEDKADYQFDKQKEDKLWTDLT